MALTPKKVYAILNAKIAKGNVPISDITLDSDNNLLFELEDGTTITVPCPFGVSNVAQNIVQKKPDGLYVQRPIVPIAYNAYQVLSEADKMSEYVIWNVYDAPQTVWQINDNTTGPTVLWSSQKLNTMIGNMEDLLVGSDLVTAINDCVDDNVKAIDLTVTDTEHVTLSITRQDDTKIEGEIHAQLEKLPFDFFKGVDTDGVEEGNVLVYNEDTEQFEAKDGLGDTFTSACEYTDYKISLLPKNKSLVADEKPTYDDTTHKIHYKQGGVSKTTEDSTYWFYYKVEDEETGDVQAYQTRFIEGVEFTLTVGGGLVDLVQEVDTEEGAITNPADKAYSVKAINDWIEDELVKKVYGTDSTDDELIDLTPDDYDTSYLDNKQNGVYYHGLRIMHDGEPVEFFGMTLVFKNYSQITQIMVPCPMSTYSTHFYELEQQVYIREGILNTTTGVIAWKNWSIQKKAEDGHCLQEAVTVLGLDQAFAKCPDNVNYYVLAKCKIQSGAPDSTKYYRVIIDKQNNALTLVDERHTYTTYKTGSLWHTMSTDLRSIPSWNNVTRDGAISNMTEYPSHTEIIKATFTTSESPNHSLGDTYYLDALAYSATDFRLKASGYGKEYISTYSVDEHGVGTWSAWKDTDSKVEKYFESTAQTAFTWAKLEDWVEDNIPNYNDTMYNITFGSVNFTTAVSPTGSSSTTYQLEVEKMSDHSIVVYATVLSTGTEEYPNGTRFRCTVSEALDQSTWEVVSNPIGVIEITDSIESYTRAEVLSYCSTKADRPKFTVICDHVTFYGSEAPCSGNPICHVTVVDTGDRQFMRASTRYHDEDEDVYYNRIYYTSKLSTGWSDWTLVGGNNTETQASGCEVGSILAWTSDNIPTGWLVCDGSEVSKTSFANLYDVIGDTYGVASDPTKFKLPDLTDRFIMGTDTDDTDLFGKVEAGLPNITGTMYFHGAGGAGTDLSNATGAFLAEGTNTKYKANNPASGANSYNDAKLDASRSSEVYGNSTTVQPPAVKLLYIICTGDGKPKTVVDTLELANTTSGTIKFGKDNLGNYGYYKGDDPVFHKFVDPGDISAEYTLLLSRATETGVGTYTLSQSVNDFDMVIVKTNDRSSAAPAAKNLGFDTIIPKYDYGKFIAVQYIGGTLQWEVKVNDTTFYSNYNYQNCQSVAVYGVKFKCEVETPSSLKLSTDLTKEIRFGTNTSGVNGYWIENDDFVPLLDISDDDYNAIEVTTDGLYVQDRWQGTTEELADADKTKFKDGMLVVTTDGGGGADSDTKLGELADVDVDSATDGDLLKYNGTTHEWEASTPKLKDLDDTNIGTPTSGDLLRYNGTKWEPYALSSTFTVDAGDICVIDSQKCRRQGDVLYVQLECHTTTSATESQYLFKWKSGTPSIFTQVVAVPCGGRWSYESTIYGYLNNTGLQINASSVVTSRYYHINLTINLA